MNKVVVTDKEVRVYVDGLEDDLPIFVETFDNNDEAKEFGAYVENNYIEFLNNL